MTTDDRYGTDARIAHLERDAERLRRAHDALTNALKAKLARIEERLEDQTRTIRSLRAQLAALDDRERWVDAFRADQRDPFSELSTRPQRTAR